MMAEVSLVSDSTVTLLSSDNIPQMEVSSENAKEQVSLQQDDRSSVHGDPPAPSEEHEPHDSKVSLISGNLPQPDASKETPKDQVSLKQDDTSSVHSGRSVPSGEQELHDSKVSLISGKLPQPDASKGTLKDQVSLKQDDTSSVHSGRSVPSGEQELHDSKVSLISGKLPQPDASKGTLKDQVSLKQGDTSSVHSGRSVPSGEQELHDSKVSLISGKLPQPDASKGTLKDQVSLKQDDTSSVHSGRSVPSGEQELHDSKVSLISGKLPQPDASKGTLKDQVSLKQGDTSSVHSGRSVPSGEQELHDSKVSLISGKLPQPDASKGTLKDQVSLKQDDTSSVHSGRSLPSGEQELHDSKVSLISGKLPQPDASKGTLKDQVSSKQDDTSSVHSGRSVPSGEQELHDSKLSLISGDFPQQDLSKETLKDQVSLKQDDNISMHSALSSTSGDQEPQVVEGAGKKWTIPPVLVVPAPSLRTLSSNESFHSLEKETEDSEEKVMGHTTPPLLNEIELEAADLENAEVIHVATEEESPDMLHSLLNCKICQLFVRTVDRLLDKSEEMMDHYMPLTEEEIDNLKEAVKELDAPPDDHQKMACLERITALSSRLRQQAYMMALGKLRLARRSTHSNLSQLQLTVDLIERSQQQAESVARESHEKLNEMCSRWNQERQTSGEVLAISDVQPEAVIPPIVDGSAVEAGFPTDENTAESGMSLLSARRSTLETVGPSVKDLRSGEHEEDACTSAEVEAKTLLMSRTLLLSLEGTYKNLLANLKDLPVSLKNKLHQSYLHMTELNARFSTAHSFSDLPSSILAKSLAIMAQAQESMDEVMEFAFQHPMGMFAVDHPQATETSSGQREQRDILKIQAAYEPRCCDDKFQ